MHTDPVLIVTVQFVILFIAVTFPGLGAQMIGSPGLHQCPQFGAYCIFENAGIVGSRNGSFEALFKGPLYCSAVLVPVKGDLIVVLLALELLQVYR